jgi:hypothetical protein
MKILFVDDHPIYRRGLIALLDQMEPDIALLLASNRLLRGNKQLRSWAFGPIDCSLKLLQKSANTRHGLGISGEDELPIVLASTLFYRRMPASVMTGDHESKTPLELF